MREELEFFPVDRRRALLLLALAVVLGLGALALVSQATSLTRVLEAFRRAAGGWFAALVAGELVAYVGYAAGYRTMARACGGPCFTYWTALRLSIVSFGAFVLASSAGGLGFDYWALRHAGEGPHRAGRRVLAFNILEWAVLGSLATLAGALALAGAGRGAPLGMALGWLVVVPACTAAALAISHGRRAEQVMRLPRERPSSPAAGDGAGHLRRIEDWIRIGLADAVGALVFLRALLARPLRYWDAPIGFTLYWLGDLLALAGSVHALGGSIGVVPLVLAYASGYVVTSAPLPAGAAGFAEAATAATLHAVGVPLATAIPAVFLYRAFTFWIPLMPALVVVPHVRALAAELERVPREERPTCDLRLS